MADNPEKVPKGPCKDDRLSFGRQQQKQLQKPRKFTKPPCDAYFPTESRYRRCLTRCEIEEFGEARDPWCQVEGRAEQSWLRSTRRHYDQLYVDHVFELCPPGQEDRCQWKVDDKKHDEMRHHFPGRSETQNCC